MMLAWLSSPERTTSPCPTSRGDDAGVGGVAAAKDHGGRRGVERGQLALERHDLRPGAGDRRDAHAPTPWTPSAVAAAAATTAGSIDSPR